jgi:MFS family permease
MPAVRRPEPAPIASLASPALVAPIAASFTFGVGLSLALPLLALLLQGRGVGGTWIGLNTAMAGVASIAATPLAVPLARRLGTATSFALAIATMTVSFLMFYLVEAFWAWFPLRLAFHGSLTVMFVLSEYWINAVVPSERRGLAMGIYGTVLSIGFAAGPVLLGLTGTAGAMPFLIGTAVFALSAAPVLFARSFEPRVEGEERTSILSFVFVAPIATFGAFAFGAVESGAASFVPVYGVEIGLTQSQAAFLVTALALGNVLSQIPLGLLADKVDRRAILTVCGLVGVVGAFAVPFTQGSLAALAAVLFVWGGIVSGLYTVGLTHLGARFTGIALVSANAAFVLMYSAGVLVGPAAMGIGLDLWPPHGFALVAGLIFAGYTVLALWRWLAARVA